MLLFPDSDGSANSSLFKALNFRKFGNVIIKTGIKASSSSIGSVLEADDDSEEGAHVEAGLSALSVCLLGALRHTTHHDVGDVGEFGHDQEQVLLDVLGDFVGGASIGA